MQAQLIGDRLRVGLEIEGTQAPPILHHGLKADQLSGEEAVAVLLRMRGKPGTGSAAARFGIGRKQRALAIVQRAGDDVRLCFQRGQDPTRVIGIVESERGSAVVGDNGPEGRQIPHGRLPVGQKLEREGRAGN